MLNVLGQISLFDLIEPQEQIVSEPPILLQAGQTVYRVLRGEVIKCQVQDEKPWLCGKENQERGYRLKKENGCYDCTWNYELGQNVFLDYNAANNKAQHYFKEHEVIKAENIRAVRTEAYAYKRDCDSRDKVAFYSVLNNGMLYIKGFYTYHHMVENTEKNIKEFLKQREIETGEAKEIIYEPEFKNMYKCGKSSNWEYAEAEYR